MMKARFVFAVAIGILAAMPSTYGVGPIASTTGPMFSNRASFDGRRLLLAGWDAPNASLWDVETGLRIQEFVGHTEGVRSVALSADGRLVLTGAGNTTFVRASTDNSVRLWNVDTGRELRRFDGITYPTRVPPVFEVAFSYDGREVLGVGAGRGLAVWDMETAQLLFQQPKYWSRPEDSFRAGLVMTRADTPGSGNWVRTWNYRSGTMQAQIDLPNPISSSRWSPDGSTVVVASGDEVSTWNSSSGKLVRTYAGHTQQVLDAMFSSDGQRVVSASADGSVRLWDRASGKLVGQLIHEGPVRRALISPDGRRILSEWSPRSYPPDRPGPYTSLWEADSGRELVLLDQAQKPLGFSPDGRTIPVVDGPTFSTQCCRLHSLLDATTGQPIRRFQR